VEAKENNEVSSSDQEQIEKNDEATAQQEATVTRLEQLDLNKPEELFPEHEQSELEEREEKEEKNVPEKLREDKLQTHTTSGPGRPKRQPRKQVSQQHTPPINNQPNHPLRRQIRQEVGRPWIPEADVRELPQGFLIQLNLPGVNKHETEVSIEEDILVVRGVRRVPNHFYQNSHLCEQIEGNFGPFERSFQLPRAVNKQQIKAEMEQGILEIFIPKKITYREPRYEYRQPTRAQQRNNSFWELF